MPSLPVLLVKILRATARPEGQPATMCIVVRRPYADLQLDLRQAFTGQDDVQVVVDRRHGERRVAAAGPVDHDRRRADRRTSGDEIAQVTFSA